MNKFFEKIHQWKDAKPKLFFGCTYCGTALLAAGVALAIALPIALAKPAPEAVKYTVNFVTDGGTAMEAVEVEQGALLSVTNPSKEQYLFSDWYKDEALTQRFDPASDKVEGNLTLFAEWVPAFDYQLNDTGTAWTIKNGLGKDYFHGNDLVIPERYQGKPVTKIANNAFGNPSSESGLEYCNFKSIIIPGTIEELGEDSFAFLGTVSYIEIKSGALTTIPRYCFQSEYTHDALIIIPKNVVAIEQSAFLSYGNGSIMALCYGGTQAEWDAINIGTGNDELSDAISEQRFYSYSEKGYNEETEVGGWWFNQPDGSIFYYRVYA